MSDTRAQLANLVVGPCSPCAANCQGESLCSRTIDDLFSPCISQRPRLLIFIGIYWPHHTMDVVKHCNES